MRVPTGEGESFVNIQEPIITQTANIQEPTSSPSVGKTTINSDYKYMTFSSIITPDINYNFTSQNTLANWKSYANTIPNATYDFSNYDAGYDGVWIGYVDEGFFQIILPATHDYLEITWGNVLVPVSGQPAATTSLLINGVVVDTITNIVQSKQYIYHYTGTPTVRVKEGFSIMSANIIIKLVKKAIYTTTFPENTEVELLILSNARFKVISPYVIPSGVVNITVGNGAGIHSSFGSISTSTETTGYTGYNSAITGTMVSYSSSAIVILRYKYTRPIIQPITIDNHFKYISFPDYGTNQTTYSLNFQEPTEIQLLLLDDLKYIENAPFTTNGSRTINVGNPSTYDTLTTNTNSTFYNFSTGHLSTITGTSTGYNKPIVIVRYKYTKSIITQINTYGFLKYNNDNVWDVSQPLLSDLTGTITKNKISDFPSIPSTLSDLSGTMLKNRISDFPSIPSTLSDLSGTMLKNRISDFPGIPTQLSQLGGQIPISRLNDFPSIPDSYTKGQRNQVITSYGNTLIYTGSSFLAINRFKYSMNTFGNYDNGFNVRMYFSISIKGTTFQEKYCFGWVYLKFNNGSSTSFNSGIIASNNNADWSLINGGSTMGDFYLGIDVNTPNASITEIYFRTS